MSQEFDKTVHSILPRMLEYMFPDGREREAPTKLIRKIETDKAHDYSAVDELVKQKDWWKAVEKNVQFYSEYIRNGKGTADPSILLAKALSTMDIEDEARVAEAFRLARVVAPMKQRACFFKTGKEGESLPREMYGWLKHRTDFLVGVNVNRTPATTGDVERAISEIILRWRDFLDICAACECGIVGEKYMRRSNVSIPRAVEKLVRLTTTTSSSSSRKRKVRFHSSDKKMMAVGNDSDAVWEEQETDQKLPPTLLRMAWESNT